MAKVIQYVAYARPLHTLAAVATNFVLVEKLEDTIVVIDDLMEAGMSNPTLMSMFTEGVITVTLVSSL